jgi:hypothetical protein
MIRVGDKVESKTGDKPEPTYDTSLDDVILVDHD